MADLDYVGHELTLRYKIGQSLVVPIEIQDASGAAIDITGRVYTAKIADKDKVTHATFTGTITDAVNGKAEYTLDTTGLGSGTDYRWEAWETNAGAKTYLFGGPVFCIDSDI